MTTKGMRVGAVYGGKTGARAPDSLPMPDRYRSLPDDREHRLPPFRLLLRDFARGIADGTSPAPNFVDGLRCQEVMEAARASSAKGGMRVTVGDRT